MTNEIGVVLAGGTGSRLLPLTKRLNKHLLPVNGQPMLHWPLRTLAQLGVKRAIVVLGGQSCGEVIEHFGTTYDTCSGVLSLVYVHQQGAGGIPVALAQAHDALVAMQASRAVVILGDNVFPAPPVSVLDPTGAVVVIRFMLDASSYGCVPVEEGIARMEELVEKPKGPPPEGTRWGALLGLYVLPVHSLDAILGNLKPSARGELEIVDVIRAYDSIYALDTVRLDGPWIDAGDPDGYRLANDPAFWKQAEPAGYPYSPWDNAGGPNECVHGYAAGIACPSCDRAAGYVRPMPCAVQPDSVTVIEAGE